MEYKQLLTLTLKLQRERWNGHQVAEILRSLSDANQQMGLYKQPSDTVEQAQCLIDLAWLLLVDKQLSVAEEAAYHAVDLLPEEGKHFEVSQSHCVLSSIHHSKGDTEKDVDHFEMALRIISSFNWHHELFQFLQIYPCPSYQDPACYIFQYSHYPQFFLPFSPPHKHHPLSTSSIYIPWSPKYLNDDVMTLTLQTFPPFLLPSSYHFSNILPGYMVTSNPLLALTPISLTHSGILN